MRCCSDDDVDWSNTLQCGSVGSNDGNNSEYNYNNSNVSIIKNNKIFIIFVLSTNSIHLYYPLIEFTLTYMAMVIQK